MLKQNEQPLGFWTLVALVAGNMIGAGVFLLPASLASYGTISLVGWIVTTGGAMFLALVFADLSRKLPRQGGPYAFCRYAFGDFVGFLVAYSYWIGMWIGSASVALAFIGYLGFFIPSVIHNSVYGYIIAIAVLWSLTIINIYGVKLAGLVQVVTTIFKLAPLILLSIVGVFIIDFTKLSEFNISGLSNVDATLAAAALTLWSFIGLESASIPSQQVANPKKNIPRATIVGTMITAMIYIISTTVVFGTVNNADLVQTGAPYGVAATTLFGTIGGLIIAFGALISCYGSLNGWILLQGQFPLAAANDGLFPKVFAKLNRNGTPAIGLIIAASLISVLLLLTIDLQLLTQFKFIISIAIFATLIVYVITVLAHIKLLFQAQATFHVRTLFVSFLALCYSIWMLISLELTELWYGACLFGSGIPLYMIYLKPKLNRMQ